MFMSKLKQFFCKHEWVCDGQTVTGVTLSWAANPTPMYTSHHHCSKCSKVWNETGMILPRSAEKALGRKWDESGWPLDANGQRIPLVVERASA